MASRALKHCALPGIYINKYFTLMSSQVAVKHYKQFPCHPAVAFSCFNYSTSSAEEVVKANMNMHKGPKLISKSSNSFKKSDHNQSKEEVSGILDEKAAAELMLDTDPDTFGTLCPQMTKQLTFDKKLDELPEEEGDRIERNFVDKETRRTRLTPSEYVKKIRSLIKARRINDAINVLEVQMLKDEKAKPDHYIYNLLISACGHAGYTKKAFQLFNNMKKRGLRPTSATYTGLFNSCANSPYPEFGLKQAELLKNLMDEKSIFIEPITYHAMIKALGRCGATDTAFSLVDEMIEKKLPLSSDTFNFLLQACISDKEAGFRHALLVWQKLRRKWIKPSVYSYNLFLRTIRECGTGNTVALQQAIDQIIQGTVLSPKEHQLLKEKNAPPTSRSSNNQICEEAANFISETSKLPNSSDEVTTVSPTYDVDTLKNAPHLENRPNLLSYKPHLGSILTLEEVKMPHDRLILVGGVNSILQEMENDNVKPTSTTFGLLLDCIPGTVAAEKALLSIMKKQNLTPELTFFNILMRKRAMRFDYESTRDVLTLIRLYNLQPDIMTFGALALSCKKKREAEDLLKTMKEADFLPNIEILGAMMRHACVQYSFGYIVYLMKYVQAEEIGVNEMFLKHLKNFHTNCIDTFKVLHKNKNKVEDANVPEFFTSKTFQESFNMFQKFYNYWLKNVKVETNVHPWAEVKSERKEQQTIALDN